MLRRRIFSLVLCLGLMTGLLSVSVSAAEVKSGVYTASMVTTYYNPDTGNVDDGGTANAALGEGMCRSATDETCLVEVDGDDIWITVRLLLQSNCSNVALYSRSGYDSYSQVSYDIMSEDAANDSIDYRIKVSDVGQKLKCTMYVSPMGRDVLWYLYVDTASLTAGSGDFVVSIDPSAEPETSAPEQNVGTSTPSTQAPSTPAASTTPSVPSAQEPEETPGNSADPVQSEEPVESTLPEETDMVEPTETPETPDTTEKDSESSQTPEQNNDETGSTVEQESVSAGVSGGVIAAIVVVAAIVVGAVIYFVKRKK